MDEEPTENEKTVFAASRTNAAPEVIMEEETQKSSEEGSPFETADCSPHAQIKFSPRLRSVTMAAQPKGLILGSGNKEDKRKLQMDWRKGVVSNHKNFQK